MSQTQTINFASLDNDFTNISDNFTDLTHQLNNYNTIYNLNTYLGQIQKKNIRDLSDVNNKLKSMSLKTKQDYFQYEYSTNYYSLRNSLMYFTILVVCGLSALLAYFSMEKFSLTNTVILLIIILALWAVVVYSILKVNANRRKFAWNQYYWKSVPVKT